MSALAFLSPGAHAVSPLAGLAVEDVSATGKVELRGDVDAFPAERMLRLTPRRALVLCDEPDAVVERARAAGLRAYDLTGALAGLRVEGDALLRRLTEVPVDRPTAAPVARGVPGYVFPLGGGRYELYVPQELGRHVAEVVLDLAEGLA
jgi:hypothetical protein